MYRIRLVKNLMVFIISTNSVYTSLTVYIYIHLLERMYIFGLILFVNIILDKTTAQKRKRKEINDKTTMTDNNEILPKITVFSLKFK